MLHLLACALALVGMLWRCVVLVWGVDAVLVLVLAAWDRYVEVYSVARVADLWVLVW